MIAATSLQPPHDPAGTDSHDGSGKQPTGKAHGPGVQLAPDEMRGNKPGADFKRDIAGGHPTTRSNAASVLKSCR